MISHVFLIQNAIGAAVAGNYVVGMTATGAPTIAQPFSLRDDSQRFIEPELRRVDNQVFCFLASDFLESGV